MAQPAAPPSPGPPLEDFLDSLASEFLQGDAAFDFPLTNDDIFSDLPPLSFISGSDPSSPGQIGSSADSKANAPAAPATPDYLVGQLGQTIQPQPLHRNSSQSSADHLVASPGLPTRSSGSGSGHVQFTQAPMDAAQDLMQPPTKTAQRNEDRAEDPMVRFKEKNRAAQRRYRERQKEKLQASEERVAELQQQLQAMRLEQETLAQRNALLEKLLAMQQRAAKGPTVGADKHAMIESQADAWWLDAQMKVYMEKAMQLGGDLIFTVRRSGPIRMTQKQVAELSHEDFGALWKEYINAKAQCLIEMQGNADSPAGRRLERLVFEGGQLKGSILMSFPDRVHAMQRQPFEKTGLATDAPTNETWAQMAESAQLSPQQKAAIIGLRNLYLRNVGILARRRQTFTSLLQTALPVSGNQCGMVDNKYSKTLGTMDALRDTLRDEHSCLMQFVLTVWRRVFTPAQAAHLNITVYPNKADVLKIAEALALAAGEPPSCEMMSKGAASGEDTQLVPVDAALPEAMRDWQAPGVDLTQLYPHLTQPAAAAQAAEGSPAAAAAASPVAAIFAPESSAGPLIVQPQQ